MKFTGTDTHFAFIDDFSIKEIGTATGWTDADQQLDIPQTALQSYNQLAWFDGVADYVSIADHDDFSFVVGTDDSAFSISAWINMNDATSFEIIGKGEYNVDAEWRLRTESDDKLHFTLYDESVNNTHETANTTATLTTYENQFIHVVATYDGTGGTSANDGITLYINGASQAVTKTGGGTYDSILNGSSPVEIGVYATSVYADGQIDDVLIYSKELSAAEILRNYNAGKRSHR